MLHAFFKKYRPAQIVFVVVVLLSSMAIFAADTTLNPYLETTNKIRVALSYLAIFYVITTLVQRNIDGNQLQLMGIVFLWWFISVFHTAPGETVQWNILMLLMLTAYCYFRPQERIKVLELYRYYVFLMCCGGILASLFFFLHIPAPCSIVPYYTGTEVQRHIYAWGDYYNYYVGFLNVMGPMARLCGWYNEPGYLGTIGSLILIADNVNLKHRINIVILVALVFTFSLAAFIILGGYLLTMALRKGKMVVAVLVFAVVSVTVIPIIFEDNPTYQYFADRLQFENGRFKGDNRTNSNIFNRLQDRQFESVEKTLFGYGTGELRKYGNLGILGIKVQLYIYGVVGLVLTYGLLLLLAWKLARGNYQAKCFVFWFFLSAYQRPYIFAPDYILILFGGIAYIQMRYGKNRLQLDEEERKNKKKLKSKPKVENSVAAPMPTDQLELL